MLRYLYLKFLRFHPLAFRQQFAGEMLEIFDCATGLSSRLLLTGDVLVSLLRQWVLRGEFRRPEVAVAGGDAGSNPGPFRSLDRYRPNAVAMFHGGILAGALLWAMAGLIVNGGKPLKFLVGVHHPRPHLVPVDRASLAESDLDTVVRIPAEPEDPLRPIASLYFKAIRVLKVLDADQDLVISPWEIFTAPAALRKLDRDGNGLLSAEECGFIPGQNSKEAVARARREFMNVNPVLAVLDADHNGEISAREITESASALKRLDRNRDGSLSPFEVLPDQAIVQAAFILARLDANGDGMISGAESESEDARPLGELLRSADANHDGLITREELRRELSLRTERQRALDHARLVLR